jgi:hypothetical protein
VPPTIAELETAFRAAQRALEDYSDSVTAKYRELYPDPPGWTGPGPDPDAAAVRAKAPSGEERAEIGRLRQAATEASLRFTAARLAARLEGGGK